MDTPTWALLVSNLQHALLISVIWAELLDRTLHANTRLFHPSLLSVPTCFHNHYLSFGSWDPWLLPQKRECLPSPSSQDVEDSGRHSGHSNAWFIKSRRTFPQNPYLSLDRQIQYREKQRITGERAAGKQGYKRDLKVSGKIGGGGVWERSKNRLKEQIFLI